MCCSTFIVYCQKATPSQQNQTYLLLVSAGLKEKKHARRISLLFLKLYFSSTFNIIKINYNNPNIKISSYIQHFTCDFQKGSAMSFLKNASKKRKKKKKWPCEILRGRAVFGFNVEKSCGGVQKTEKYMISTKYQYLK